MNPKITLEIDEGLGDCMVSLEGVGLDITVGLWANLVKGGEIGLPGEYEVFY
ncbi:MAG: hypothetical protein JRJ31_00985 [Deltaproteobacteria bacterium]|nr:hypothetical protein [Deltaproteobacteria bacterium]